ncbi:MAG: hypothetical protein KAS62_01815 [Candidatus Delongbacteria bacterium]|nr:hypothetical protein [Candidatus Delongbacteria bacterium]
MSALFSQRKGITTLEKNIQFESLDTELRNQIWSELVEFLAIFNQEDGLGYPSESSEHIKILITKIWRYFFKLPLDTFAEFELGSRSKSYMKVRECVIESEWWKVLDLIEFIIKNFPRNWDNSIIIKRFNIILEKENSAYRIVDEEIVDITDKNEIESIETTISKQDESGKHLSHALKFLSDRKEPDYRNSIKESISAVESCCREIVGNSKADLSGCIKEIKKVGIMHPAFEQALTKLYAYTSDENGVRHALTDKDYTPSYADAKFMLVTCSAFVNFIWTKVAELGIKIGK